MNFYKIINSALFLLLIVACTREVDPPPIPSSSDNISGKRVRYTVLVVPGGSASFKSTNGADSAIVSLVMNDSIYSTATDTNGLATFNNLAAGIAAVTVRYPGHTTANLIVDITAKSDTGYDANNLRNASTMVALFPHTGAGTATISGKILADLDLITAGLEIAPAGLQVNAFIEPGQLIDYVNHSGDGEILSISYENTTNSTLTDSNSDYEINVPATGSGLDIIITASDFQYDQIIVGGTQRKIFKAIQDTVKTISGNHYFIDPQFD